MALTEGMRPFFSYYGGKWRLARKYPQPAHDLVIEPFAGGAGYSVAWGAPQVMLFDRDERVIGAWQYLIRTSASEIRDLPLLAPGQSTDDLDVCQEARWVIGWWCNSAVSSPRKTLSKWARENPGSPRWWGAACRERIAVQVDSIRAWTATLGDYHDAPDVEATWFVDPPYVDKGKHYRHGSQAIDFAALGEWVRSRRGLAIACENEGAGWLPFSPFTKMWGAGRASTEVVYIQRVR